MSRGALIGCRVSAPSADQSREITGTVVAAAGSDLSVMLDNGRLQVWSLRRVRVTIEVPDRERLRVPADDETKVGLDR